MSRREIIAVAIAGPEECLIMGQLGDGTPDEDGQILDPAWLTVAASTWRYQSGGLMPPDGIIQEVWLEGDVTRVMGRVYGRRAAALMTKGVTAGLSLGIARPTIQRDPAAPMGRITGGTIHEISLDGCLFQAEQDIFLLLARQLAG